MSQRGSHRKLRHADGRTAIVPVHREWDDLVLVVFLPPVPALAVDPKSGTMYAAFSDGRLGDPDVLVWASADGGRGRSILPVATSRTPPGASMP